MIAMTLSGISFFFSYASFLRVIYIGLHCSGDSDNTIVMIHDAFQSISYWNGFMPYPQYQGVILDTHIYQMFSDEVRSKFPTYARYFSDLKIG